MHLQPARACGILAGQRTPMIKLLRINNIALIPSLEIELGSGLTLLTGETGAGKTIVIDALGLLLGERSTTDLIRTGEERASVEAIFDGSAVRSFLETHGLPFDGDDLVIRRELQASGKGRATVNGGLVPVSLLRELAPNALLSDGAALAFRQQRLRIDPRAQALVALLRHSLHQGTADPLEAESLALTLVRRVLGPRSPQYWRGGGLLTTPPSSVVRPPSARR